MKLEYQILKSSKKVIKRLCAIDYYEIGNPAYNFIDEQDKPLCVAYHITQEI